MTAIRTSLQRHQPYTPMNDDELRRKAAQLWHETGTVMAKPEWIGNEIDRQHTVNIGVRLYGKRGQ